MLPEGRSGTMSTSHLPAAGWLTPLSAAAAGLTALSSAKGPPTQASGHSIAAMAAASTVLGIFSFTTSRALSTPTLGRS